MYIVLKVELQSFYHEFIHLSPGIVELNWGRGRGVTFGTLENNLKQKEHQTVQL